MVFAAEKDRIVYRNDEHQILAEVDFPDDGSGVVHVIHTVVDDSLRGQGIAGRLMEAMVEELRNSQKKAMLVCSYAKGWFGKHPEAADVLYQPVRKPLIAVTPGISADEDQISVSKTTMDAIREAGGIPMLLQASGDSEVLNSILDRVDGLLFTGGGDIDPTYFGEYQHPQCGTISPLRDAMELKLARMAATRGNIPVLGICRGMQVLAVALGGKLWQDIPSQYPEYVIRHRQMNPSRCPSHPVMIVKESRLHEIVKGDRIMVNSLHHQAVKDTGEMIVTATAPDGIIEAVEHPGLPFFIGIQWHPERMWQHDDASCKLFRAFVEASVEAHSEV